jgi:hypothetical protein
VRRVLRLPSGVLPLCMTVIVVVVFFLVFLTFPTVKPGSTTLLISEMVRQYELVGSYDQRMAHSWSLVATLIVCAVGFVATRRGVVRTTGPSAIPTLNIWICLLVSIVALVVYARLVPRSIVNDTVVLVAGFFAFVVLAPCLPRRVVDNAVLLAIGAYAALIILPGILTVPIPLTAADAGVLAQHELHLNSLTVQGVGISAGQNLFKELPYSYGLLMPSLISVIDHRYGPMSVGDQARFVQICQILFALTAMAAYFCFRPRNYLGIWIILLLAAPYWASAGPAIWHPNQSGFRSLTFPIGILALIIVDRFRPRFVDWWLGAIGGVAMLINAETAIAVGIGYLGYLGLRTGKWPIVSVLRMATAGLAVFIVYLILFRLGLGRLPFGTNIFEILDALSRLTSGSFGGRLFAAGPSRENYYLVPFALVMFAHAIYVVVDAFGKLGNATLSHRSALRASIAMILLVWLSYYFNFPNWWQIWTLLFLYGFLLLDLLDPRLAGLGVAWREGALWMRPMRARVERVIVLLLLALMISHGNGLMMMYMRGFMYPSWVTANHGAAVVSGILMPRDMADELSGKTAKLSELYKATGGKVIYLTYNAAFIPTMSRIFEPLPERDLFSSVRGDADLDPVMDKILGKKPEMILIDAPTGSLAVTGTRKEFFDRVRRAVARQYHLAETEAGWQIWRPGISP